MKSNRLLSLVTTLVFLFTLAISVATAGSMGNGAAQRQRLVIESFDAGTGIVACKSMVDNSVHTYKIDATTRVYLGTTKATLDQIQVGQKVQNYAAKPGPAPQTLSMIFVSQPAAAPVPPVKS